MNDGLKIRWTLEGLNGLESIIRYFESRWSEKELRVFFLQMEQALDRIRRMPYSCPAIEKRKDIRKCVLSKQTSIFYQIKDNTVVILSFFDNRQDPKNLRLD